MHLLIFIIALLPASILASPELALLQQQIHLIEQ